MCDCLDSMLSAKIMAYIGKNVTRLPELETMNIEAAAMVAKTSKPVKDALNALKWDRCHSIARYFPNFLIFPCQLLANCSPIRSTQVEELMGTKDYLSTNIVYTTLVWCFVAVLGSLYVTGTHEHEKWKGINLQWAAFIGVVMASTTTPAFFIAGASWGCGITSFIISSLVLAVVVTMMVMGDPNNANHHVVRSITLTSICYTIGAWASWAILCSVTQQRDYLFALSTGFMVMVIGIVSFSSRYAYHVVVNYSDVNEAQRDLRYSAYKNFFSNAWYCNIAIVVSLLATPGTFFVAGVFSNTNRVALASTIIMLSYPIIQKVHLAPPKGSRKDMEATTVDSDTTLYVATDMVARYLSTHFLFCQLLFLSVRR